jgi:2-polyprenyl-3-methyl-5-hydroxy-6-metoxy-1,4-benzoquinol methylase
MLHQLIRHLMPFTPYPYAGEKVACPVCSCDRATQIARIDRRFKLLPTVACDGCGLLYTNPMPSDAELSDYYTRLYRLDYQGATSAPKQLHLQKRGKEAATRVARLGSLLHPSSRTLDFGCGTGEFVTSLLALGHDAHGFEPGQTYGGYARSIHGERITVQSWQEVRYGSRFDLVSCFHVLEHLRNPVDALRQMAEWAKPDGLVYVEVPNLGLAHLNKGFGAFHFAHVVGFNHHNLILAGARVGLRPRQVIGPTKIIFEHGLAVDQTAQAEHGRRLAADLYASGRATKSYVRYQFAKVLGRTRRVPQRALRSSDGLPV